MDTRYQVFVSSTSADLRDARQEVILTLLRLDMIPAGMEIFPASNVDLFDLIKRVIDDCDYFLVIVGNSYGSVSQSGVSYTQIEYEYALEKGKPIMAFLHSAPDSLPAETTKIGRDRLKRFRTKLKKKPCCYWSSPTELALLVSSSLLQQIKAQPAIGWIKANKEPRTVRVSNDIIQDAEELGIKRLFGTYGAVQKYASYEDFIDKADMVYLLGTSLSVTLLQEGVIARSPKTLFRFIYCKLESRNEESIERALKIIHNAPIQDKLSSTHETLEHHKKNYSNVETLGIPFVTPFSAIMALNHNDDGCLQGRLQIDHYLLRTSPDRRFWLILEGPGTMLFDRYQTIIEDIWENPGRYSVTR
jgi:nucleoside 2-deoxyribosyltransferase